MSELNRCIAGAIVNPFTASVAVDHVGGMGRGSTKRRMVVGSRNGSVAARERVHPFRRQGTRSPAPAAPPALRNCRRLSDLDQRMTSCLRAVDLEPAAAAG